MLISASIGASAAFIATESELTVTTSDESIGNTFSCADSGIETEIHFVALKHSYQRLEDIVYLFKVFKNLFVCSVHSISHLFHNPSLGSCGYSVMMLHHSYNILRLL